MKNKKMGIVAVLVMLVAITLNSVGGTYAKYVSKIDMTDEARVAKWSVSLKDGEKRADGTYDLNLFDKSYSYNGLEYVKSMGTDNVIAPGTKGQAIAQLDVTSEVRYNMAFKIEKANDFIVYFTVNSDKTVKAMSLNATDSEFGSDTVYEYRPLTYTINYFKDANTTATQTLTDKKADDLEALLNAYNANNTNIASHSVSPAASHNWKYQIDWKWDTVNSLTISNKTYNADGTVASNKSVTLKDANEINKLDTFAGENLSDASDKVTFKFSVVVEQVASDHAKTTTTTTAATGA